VHLDAWLQHYNHEWPQRGYRNMGNRPIETITQYLSDVESQNPNTV